MNASTYSDHVRKDLQARMDALREARAAESARARELAAAMPPVGELDDDIKLWNTAGYYAGYVCVWITFILPILLILEVWD